MKELNKDILEKSLQKLPAFEPNERVWNSIDLELTAEENDADLQISLSSLREYNPSDSVWEKIDLELENEEDKIHEEKSTTFKIRYIARWAAAAVVLILAGSYWIWNVPGEGQDSVSISFSEETVPAGFLEVDWETDEEAFSIITEFCKNENITCQQPDFKIMTAELEELNAAREELKYAMDNYGNDPELIAQLTEIEHVRTDLLKKLVKRI